MKTAVGVDVLELLDGPDEQTRDGVSRIETPGVVVGKLLALTDAGQAPLVTYPGQSGSRAVRARTTIDLHGGHIGKQVLLVFEGGNAQQPIVIGLLRETSSWPLQDRPVMRC